MCHRLLVKRSTHLVFVFLTIAKTAGKYACFK